MTNLGQVPGYARIKYYQVLIDEAKRNYLISLGYILEKIDNSEDTIYVAIHPNYYLTDNEREEKEYEEDRYIPDGRHHPEDYPEGAFIVINSCCIRDNPNYLICTSDFLDENECSIEYLNVIEFVEKDVRSSD